MKKSNKRQPVKADKKNKKIAAAQPQKAGNYEDESKNNLSQPEEQRSWNKNNPENQIVNEQEQNNAVNRHEDYYKQDDYYKEDKGRTGPESDRPGFHDIETEEGDNIDPEHRAEGDDTGTLDNRVPNL
jgi:hypothetical protein